MRVWGRFSFGGVGYHALLVFKYYSSLEAYLITIWVLQMKIEWGSDNSIVGCGGLVVDRSLDKPEVPGSIPGLRLSSERFIN